MWVWFNLIVIYDLVRFQLDIACVGVASIFAV